MRGMKPLPMPIRVAAGLVATVIEEAEHLPRRLTEVPVTAVSQALHAMRMQQKVTDLAIKGDRALSSLRPVPETPIWARFDEDEEPSDHTAAHRQRPIRRRRYVLLAVSRAATQGHAGAHPAGISSRMVPTTMLISRPVPIPSRSRPRPRSRGYRPAGPVPPSRPRRQPARGSRPRREERAGCVRSTRP